MELSKQERYTALKNINNTGKLPGFADGTLHSQYGGWQQPAWKGMDWTNLTPEQQYINSGYAQVPTFERELPGQKTPYEQMVENGINSESPAALYSKSKIGGQLTYPNTPNNRSSNNVSVGLGALNAAPAVIGAVGDVYTAHQYNKSADELLSQGGSSSSSVGGVGYNIYNGPNYAAEMDEVRKSNATNTLKSAGSGAAAGAAIGSIIPGFGTVAGGVIGGVVGAIGGIFGGARRKKKAMEALAQARQQGIRNNDFMRSSALSSAIGQNAALRVGNTQSQVLAADGLTPNARVSNGETIINPDGSTFRVGRGKDNKDSIPVHLSDGQGVITNKYGLSDLAQINPGLALNMQTTLKQQGRLSGYKNGKLPRFENGWGNITSGVLGGLASIQQYLDAAGQDIKVPDIYAANPYEQAALNSMANTYINPIPAANKIWDAYRYANWSVDRSGGLSGGQRNRTKAANLATTQRSLADAYIAGQAQNNQYRQSFDQARLNAGQATRAAQMDANKFKEQYTAAAHNARQQGMQMGIYNFINQLQSYYANEFKRRQFNDTMDLYKQQQQLDRERLDWEIGKNKPTEKIYLDPYKQIYVPKGVAMFPNPINNNWRNVRLNLR